MNPYVLISIKGKNYKTRISNNAGKIPIWNEKISIPINNLNEAMKISCFDEDVALDDLIGDTFIKPKLLL
jgi:Ca2+-dependent lipid-binding protein